LHFANCNNANCNAIVSINPDTLTELDEIGILCDECRKKAMLCHIVTCETCSKIVKMSYTLKCEEKEIYYVEKCTNCNGNIKDERTITHSVNSMFMYHS